MICIIAYVTYSIYDIWYYMLLYYSTPSIITFIVIDYVLFLLF